MPQNNNCDGRTAIYPGTFDPITNGHLSLVQRATNLFDHIIIAVAKNAGKDPLFTHEERIELVRQSLKDLNHADQIEVIEFDGLLARLAKKLNACAIIRGLRAVSDFEYEFQLASMNRHLAPDVETLFMTPDENYSFISSSLVKEIARLDGDVSEFVSEKVHLAMRHRFEEMG